MEEAGKLTILRKTYEREDLYDASLVIAATNDHKINQDIYAACKCLGIPVNVCQDRERCDFYFPGLAMQDNLVVGVSTSGQEKKRQKGIAGRLQQFLDEDQAGILQKKRSRRKGIKYAGKNLYGWLGARKSGRTGRIRDNFAVCGRKRHAA